MRSRLGKLTVACVLAGIVLGLYLLDKAGADALRKFVSNGGTVIMTAYSAEVNENNQWYDTPLPGRLTDVFGLRTNEFYNAGTLVTKLGDEEVKGDIPGEPKDVTIDGTMSGVLTGQRWKGTLRLAPFGVDLL